LAQRIAEADDDLTGSEEFEVGATRFEIGAERADLQHRIRFCDRCRTRGRDFRSLLDIGGVGKTCALPCPGLADCLPASLGPRRTQCRDKRHSALTWKRLAEKGNFHAFATAGETVESRCQIRSRRAAAKSCEGELSLILAEIGA